MDNPTCKSCRWFDPAQGVIGLCRRSSDVWMRVRPSHFCGEHQPRQPAEAEALVLPGTKWVVTQDRGYWTDEITVKLDRLGGSFAISDGRADLHILRHEVADDLVRAIVAAMDRIGWGAPDALSGTPPRPRIDPETRRVLECCRRSLRTARDHSTGFIRESAVISLGEIAGHLAKLDGEGDHD